VKRCVEREDPRNREVGKDVPDEHACAVLLGAAGTFTTYKARNEETGRLLSRGRWRCELRVAGLEPVVTYQDNYSDTVAFLRQAGWYYKHQSTRNPDDPNAWLKLSSHPARPEPDP
jgi:hypothetical protein